jgi:hypothetical protein
MLVDLSKDELQSIVYYLEGAMQGNDDDLEVEELMELSKKLDNIASACECKEQKRKKVNLPTPEWEE